MTLPLELRPYQKAAVDAMGDGVLLVSPTGTGKTLMMVMAARRAIAEGKRVLWVAHREELLFQASRTAGDTGILIASVQSVRRGWKGPRVDVLIVDEAHHLPADDWSLLLEEQFPMAELWGATATPERSDGRGLGALFRAMHVAISIPDAVAAGYLVPSDVLRPDRAMKPGELAEEPLKAYEKNAKGTKTILFAPTVPISIQYAQEFTAAGYPARAVFGEMRAEDRRAALADYVAGKVRVLVSVAVLTEGTDLPDTETIILARGFGTAGGYLQAVGRGLRPAPGKKRCLVLDLKGVYHAFGAPDEDRIYSLDGAGIRRPGDDVEVRFCPVCGAPSKTTECEACGYAGELRIRKPRVLGLALERFARIRQDNEEEQACRLAKWIGEAVAKGHKPGRAWFKFTGAYGFRPSPKVAMRAKAIVRASNAG